jgi:hypothetical protein
MQRESKKLTYKFASGLSNGDTLQSVLTGCLRSYKKSKDRVELLGPNGEEMRFINVSRQNKGMLLGVFHKLTRGSGQYIIDMADAADAWNVELITAKLSEKDKREFIEGSLYFGIWKNNVVMHQTNPCRADQLQDYATWFITKWLARKGSGAVQAPLIALSDPLPKSIRKKAGRPVKSIRLGGALQTGPVKQDASGGTTTVITRAGGQLIPKGKMWEGVKNFFAAFGTPLPTDLSLDGALGDNDIKVSLELSCSKKNAQTTAGEALSVFGRALSHADNVDFEIELADGTKIRPRELKVEKFVRVDCVQKQPVIEPLFNSMIEWMGELVDSQTVIEEEAFANV